MKTRLFFLILLLTELTESGIAQTKCSECDIALTSHATDKFSEDTHKSLDEGMTELFSKSFEEWSKLEMESSNSVEVSAGLALFKASVGSKSSESEKREAFNSLKENYSKSAYSKENTIISISKVVASPTAYEEWGKCMKGCPRSNERFISKYWGEDPKIVVAITFANVKDRDVDARITNIKVIPEGAVLSGEIEIGALLEKYRTLVSEVKRPDPTKAITIVINLEGYDPETIEVPGVTPNPPIEIKCQKLEIPANTFLVTKSKNVAASAFFPGLVTENQTWTTSIPHENILFYEIDFQCQGKYRMEILFASTSPRPVSIYFNDTEIHYDICNSGTGGDYKDNVMSSGLIPVTVTDKNNTLIIKRHTSIPHLSLIRFIPVN